MNFETFLEGYYKGSGDATSRQYHHEDQAAKYDEKRSDHIELEQDHRRESSNTALSHEERLAHRRKANFHLSMTRKASKIEAAHTHLAKEFK